MLSCDRGKATSIGLRKLKGDVSRLLLSSFGIFFDELVPEMLVTFPTLRLVSMAVVD